MLQSDNHWILFNLDILAEIIVILSFNNNPFGYF